MIMQRKFSERKFKNCLLSSWTKLVNEHLDFFGYTWVRIPPAPKKKKYLQNTIIIKYNRDYNQKNTL